MSRKFVTKLCLFEVVNEAELPKSNGGVATDRPTFTQQRLIPVAFGQTILADMIGNSMQEVNWIHLLGTQMQTREVSPDEVRSGVINAGYDGKEMGCEVLEVVILGETVHDSR